MSAGPLLLTPRLELWRPAADDLDGLHAMLDDADTTRYLGTAAASKADSFARLLRNAGSWALYGYGSCIVRERGTSAVIGNCGLFRSFRGFGSDSGFDDAIEAGWIIHRDHWRKGYAREAMRAALEWFDAHHGPARVVCMIEQGNDASCAVAASLGFVEMGERRASADDPVLLLFCRG